MIPRAQSFLSAASADVCAICALPVAVVALLAGVTAALRPAPAGPPAGSSFTKNAFAPRRMSPPPLALLK